jgi:diaminopimelate epimerase
MQGLGNDFVLVNCLETALPPEEKLAALSEAVCDRHFGVGGDGMIFILPDDTSDYRMRMFNPDGSESEMCGNGIRCFGKYLFDIGAAKGEISVATAKGLQHIELQEAQPGANPLKVRVDMGTPRLQRSQIPMAAKNNSSNGSSDGQVINEALEVDGATHFITAVSMGNPHCVIFVDDVESVALKEIGFRIEHHETFPERTNVHFVQVLGAQKLWVRHWERGAGDTLACGTGACASVVAASLTGKIPGRGAIAHLPGGDLDIEWAANNHVYMTGPATTVFEGTLDRGLLKALD